MFRFLLWRVLGVLCGLVSFALLAGLLDGGLKRTLRPLHPGTRTPAASPAPLLGSFSAAVSSAPGRLAPVLPLVPLALTAGGLGLLGLLRLRARRRRRYVRLRLLPYRGDTADAHALTRMFAALQARLARRWWERLLAGQPSIALEVHHRPTAAGRAAHVWLAVSCPAGERQNIEAAFQVAFPNLRLEPCEDRPGSPPFMTRLKKQRSFIERAGGAVERFERDPEPLMDRLMTTMAATGEPAIVQLALTPAPALFEGVARALYRRREERLGRSGRGPTARPERSLLADTELRGSLELQHRPLFFADIRVLGCRRRSCEVIASILRAQRAENRLVERSSRFRQGAFGGYARRIERGEGNPLPSPARSIFATSELAGLWQLPSIGYARVPFSRTGVPLAPAPPEIFRPASGGTLRDALGPVSIHVALRRQNTAVPGTVEQGKSSYLVATVAEDLLRDRCAVIVLDPKGDAADAALSAVPMERRCTLLDFAHPTCGFNPLAVDAPADVIADYVVAALKNLFTDTPWIVMP